MEWNERMANSKISTNSEREIERAENIRVINPSKKEIKEIKEVQLTKSAKETNKELNVDTNIEIIDTNSPKKQSK